jgi:hypothetical protein
MSRWAMSDLRQFRELCDFGISQVHRSDAKNLGLALADAESVIGPGAGGWRGLFSTSIAQAVRLAVERRGRAVSCGLAGAAVRPDDLIARAACADESPTIRGGRVTLRALRGSHPSRFCSKNRVPSAASRMS